MRREYCVSANFRVSPPLDRRGDLNGVGEGARPPPYRATRRLVAPGDSVGLSLSLKRHRAPAEFITFPCVSRAALRF